MIIFIGDKPSKRMKPGAKPFQGAACEKRLMEWIEYLGINKYELHNRTDKSVNFNIRRAQYFNYQIIALGNVASNSLGSYPHFKLPHPSGRNRQINNKAFIVSKLNECKKYLNIGKN